MFSQPFFAFNVFSIDDYQCVSELRTLPNSSALFISSPEATLPGSACGALRSCALWPTVVHDAKNREKRSKINISGGKEASSEQMRCT